MAEAERTVGERAGNLRGPHEHRSRSTKEIQGAEWQSWSHYRFYVPAYGGRAALKQMTRRYHRNFLAGESLRRKLPIDMGGTQMLPASDGLTLAERFNLPECQVFTFHSLHLASHFIHSAKNIFKVFFISCMPEMMRRHWEYKIIKIKYGTCLRCE